jgi:hypothetical protein
VLNTFLVAFLTTFVYFENHVVENENEIDEVGSDMGKLSL